MITSRQAKILAAIVKEYSQSGHPVGSEELLAKYHLGVSPATVRNDMQALVDEGFLTQPHTSAGRAPTDKGYRYFVNNLMHHWELTIQEQRRLRLELLRLKHQYLELGRSISKLLSHQAGGAAFALLPESVSTSGLSEVISDEVEPYEIREVARFMDELEERGGTFLKKDTDEVETFIGKESPVPLAADFSLLATQVKLPSGERGVIGIVGPKRMKYAKNISLLKYISKLLSSGLGAIILINLGM